MHNNGRMKKILLPLWALLMTLAAPAQNTHAKTYNRCVMQNGQGSDFNAVLYMMGDSVEMRTFRPWAHPTINPLAVFRFARYTNHKQQYIGRKTYPQQEQIIVTTNVNLVEDDGRKLPKSLTLTINDRIFMLGNNRR